jgi:DNA topoisomerase I
MRVLLAFNLQFRVNKMLELAHDFLVRVIRTEREIETEARKKRETPMVKKAVKRKVKKAPARRAAAKKPAARKTAARKTVRKTTRKAARKPAKKARRAA